jgi:hypothetical protein
MALINRLIGVQDVRNFLLHPRIQVMGRPFDKLVAYNVTQTRQTQKGHALCM